MELSTDCVDMKCSIGIACQQLIFINGCLLGVSIRGRKKGLVWIQWVVVRNPVSLGSVHSGCCFEVPGLSVRLSVCVWGRVVAGSPSCVDVLRLSALVATHSKM